MPLQLLHLTSAAELQQHATAWDALWQRSDVTIPTAQANHIQQWLARFGKGREFHALVVERDGEWLAALPLVSSKLRGMLTVGSLTSNEWTPTGDLLVDPTADDGVFDCLVGGIEQLPWTLLWTDYAIVSASRWERLIAACARIGLATEMQPQFHLPRVDIRGTWEAYRASWSSNHRQNMQRYRRKLATAHGEVRLERVTVSSNAALNNALERGFAIEDRSWKGLGGSSVLRSVGMVEFFTQQAKSLAARGQLELYFLHAGEQTIAFLYAWAGKGVLHGFKIGYDDAFAAFSPGQLLLHEVLHSLFEHGTYHTFDGTGPVTDATARWMTSDYVAGRVVIAPPGLLSQTTMFAYQRLLPTLRRWLGRAPTEATDEKQTAAL